MSRAEFEKSCPKPVRSLVDEVYICLQSECHRAVAMTVRAILEAVMIHRVGDRGGFSANQRNTIEPVLEAGHAAIHRNFEPPGTSWWFWLMSPNQFWRPLICIPKKRQI